MAVLDAGVSAYFFHQPTLAVQEPTGLRWECRCGMKGVEAEPWARHLVAQIMSATTRVSNPEDIRDLLEPEC